MLSVARICLVACLLTATTGRLARAGETGKEPTRQEVEARIKKAGTTKPDWWDSVKLNHPKSLRLDWSPAPGKGWKPNVNMGAHYVSSVWPRPDKWKYGVKLARLALEKNPRNAKTVKSAREQLGRMWCDFLGDPARAAYWWRGAGNDPVKMADCYRLMGAKQMAIAELRRAGNNRGRAAPVVKLWAELGDLNMAIRMAQGNARGSQAADVLLAAGNAHRFHGDMKKAMAFYLQVGKLGNNRRYGRAKGRAKNSLAALRGCESFDMKKVRDGTYSGSCKGFRGPVNVSVTVAGGKVTVAKVAKHREDWSGRSTFDIPKKIIEKNGIKGVDAVTRATTSSDAVINAFAAALKKGAK